MRAASSCSVSAAQVVPTGASSILRSTTCAAENVSDPPVVALGLPVVGTVLVVVETLSECVVGLVELQADSPKANGASHAT
jgi:hypothetical protein